MVAADCGDRDVRDERIRCFVAIALPRTVGQALARASRALRSEAWGSALRWVRPESGHLTLRFLGEIERARLEALIEALGPAVAQSPVFDVGLRRLEFFPARGRPRVLVVRADGGEQLGLLAGRVERAVVGCGMPPEERPFRAHVTLGRVRAALARRSGLPPISPEPHFAVREVVLFRSILGRAGAVYEELGRCPLKGGRAHCRSRRAEEGVS